MEKTFKIKDEKETFALAEKLSTNVEKGDIFFLMGNLGMGKSVFARAFIRSLMDDTDLTVPSPTFTLLQTYTPKAHDFDIYHYDFYRLEDAEEIYDLDWDLALDHGVILAEWPEKIEQIPIKRPVTWICFKKGDTENERIITFKRNAS